MVTVVAYARVSTDRQAEKQTISRPEAEQNLKALVEVLDLLDRAVLSQHADNGQASFILRVTPSRLDTNPTR